MTARRCAASSSFSCSSICKALGLRGPNCQATAGCARSSWPRRIHVGSPVRTVSFDDLEFADEMALLEGRPYSGIALEADSEGTPISENTYLNGLKHGSVRSWHESGTLCEQVTYWSGLPHGLAKVWSPDGQVLAKRLFEFGECVGEHIFSPDGSIRQQWELEAHHPTAALVQMRRRARPDAPRWDGKPRGSNPGGWRSPVMSSRAVPHHSAQRVLRRGYERNSKACPHRGSPGRRGFSPAARGRGQRASVVASSLCTEGHSGVHARCARGR